MLEKRWKEVKIVGKLTKIIVEEISKYWWQIYINSNQKFQWIKGLQEKLREGGLWGFFCLFVKSSKQRIFQNKLGLLFRILSKTD